MSFIMSSQPPQGNQPLQPEAIIPSPSAPQESALNHVEQDASDNQKLTAAQEVTDSQELTSDGKYWPLQLYRRVKFGRIAAETNDIPASIEDALLRLKNRLLEYNQPVYIAPMAKPNLQAPDNRLLPLMDMVEGFLADDSQVMLVLGDSGAGKSTFNQHLEHVLWQGYKPGGRIPLFINLPALDRPDKEMVVEHLKSVNFSEEQIWDLKQHRQLLLICDGYDESQLTSNLHTTNLFNRPGQWNVKLFITCRTQYLGPDYRDRFAPKATSQYHRTASNLFQEAVIAPFSKEQIELYVEQFVPLIPRTWVKKDYMDKLATIPNLMDLVRNPFLLTLALEALPSVVKNNTTLSNLRVTRAELYDTFVDHWLKVNKRRLQDQTLKDKRQAFEDLLEDGFVHNGIVFQKELAWAIFQQQEGRPVVEYSNMRDKSPWKANFFGPKIERSLLRDASLLSRTGNQYRFIHRSVLEYFFSCFVWDTSKDGNEFAPHVYSEATGVSLPVTDHPLSKRSLVPEPSVIQFLAERVQMQPIFKKYLLALVELSKSDSQASMAAANAITILVRAGRHFNGADLRGIRIPGANLTGGQFDSAQLQDSDLAGVIFTKAWIRQADFTRARVDETRFGELPNLQGASWVQSCAFSSDGRFFATGLRNGNISIYDTTTWTRIRLLHGHETTVLSLAYSTTGLQLLSGWSDGTVRLWDCKSDATDRVLKEHSEEVTAVAFSPSGIQFASASADKSVRLWDTQTGTVAFVIQDFGDVSGIAYSPDGNNIASCFMYGQVRLFDTRTGLQVLSSGTSGKNRCLAYSPNGQSVVSGDIFGDLQLWEATTMMPRIKWRGHSGRVTSVEFSPNGQWIVSVSDDKTVKMWDGYAATLVSIFTGHTSCITSVAFSPDGSLIASGSMDRTVRLWEVNSVGFGLDVDGAFDSKPSVAYSPDGRFLISGSRAGVVQQHDAESGEIGLVIRRQEFRVNSVAYSSDGRQIAMGGSGGDITLWSTHTGALENTLRGHTRDVKVVAFSPCGQWIASCDKLTVRLWDARSGTFIQVISGDRLHFIRTLSFSSSGTEIAFRDYSGMVEVWNVTTGKSRMEEGGLNLWFCFVRYLPSSLQVVSCEGGKGADLWDEDGRHSRVILQHSGITIQHFAFSSCGQWIASVEGNTVHLWRSPLEERPQDWKYVLAVEGCLGVIVEIVWRPGKLEFATADVGGSTRLWRVVERFDKVVVQLVWGFGGGGSLVASGSLLDDAIGLNAINRSLLEQRRCFLQEPIVTSFYRDTVWNDIRDGSFLSNNRVAKTKISEK
ncbi:WD repeats region domain-containing protein [Linnemannia hyalina]|uniref:WD repeats region domain-containing protein n=1 Tax=Linnemannia hyalina TaxID=64524 RepID=A0A9P7Y3U2_9FUNG|nr:WD repeats region domain-containing protein [Linnemannia hyalina]